MWEGSELVLNVSATSTEYLSPLHRHFLFKFEPGIKVSGISGISIDNQSAMEDSKCYFFLVDKVIDIGSKSLF